MADVDEFRARYTKARQAAKDALARGDEAEFNKQLKLAAQADTQLKRFENIEALKGIGQETLTKMRELENARERVPEPQPPAATQEMADFVRTHERGFNRLTAAAKQGKAEPI